MRKKLSFLLFCLFFIMTELSATIIHVPADYPSIQTAILSTTDGDTVLISPGIYYENINFRGHQIVLTSMYYLNEDTSYICSTVINGSQPAFADTASCIILNSGEDSTAIIQGFTITGGRGTKWVDIHGAGTYREGGGILTEYSSPIIRWNHIINNSVISSVGVVSSGGGGIRSGDGAPIIYGNIIAYNFGGGYGGGIVSNYCSNTRIKNNLIVHNSGGMAYGGGGIWANGSLLTQLVIVENNVIAYNHVTGTGTYPGKGGGIFVFGIQLLSKNNIVWGNTQTGGNAMVNFGGSISSTYTDADYVVAGPGNISIDPLFEDTISFHLSNTSPCIDMGDSSAIYFDSSLASIAVYPSLGNERNDMGAYGGKLAKEIPVCTLNAVTVIENDASSNLRIEPNPVSDHFVIKSDQLIELVEMFNMMGEKISSQKVKKYAVALSVDNMTNGVYLVMVTYADKHSVTRKLQVIK